jgi:hypothetical protein
MGILSSIGGWVSGAISVARNIVKGAENVLSKAASVVDALLQGREIFNESDMPKYPPTERRNTNERPDIMGSGNSNKSDIAELLSDIDDNRKKLSSIQDKNELEHRQIQLQIDIMELIVSASTFERFTNNINLHASNLNIHLQTIQNTAGLLDSVNRQRVAIKALMGTVNHLINVTGSDGTVRKLEGLDIDVRPDSISIHGAYKSFENTRTLLINEIESFSNSIQEQMNRIDAVRAAARNVPAQRAKVNSWLSDSVEPKLLDAKSSAEKLKGELEVFPRLENNLRRELENIKQEII